jgi:ABC-type proline/glycine betaine transport system ATPase subunit
VKQEDKDGKIVLTGSLMKCDEPYGSSGRIYPREVWEKEIARLQGQVGDGRFFATVDNEGESSVNLAKVAGLVKGMKLEGDDVETSIEILDTPKGELVKKLVQHGEVEFKSCGVGTVTEGVVQDDFRMTNVSIVPKEKEDGTD